MSLHSYREPGGEPALGLAGPARAAVLLLAMGEAGASKLLKHFSPEELRAMQASVSAHRRVSAPEIDRLVDDFQDAFKAGAGMSALGDDWSRLLRQSLSNDELALVVADAGGGAADDGTVERSVFDDLGALGAAALQPMLANEHPQVAAVVIARLDPELAAEVVAGLDADLRNDVMRRMLDARELAPENAAALEDALRAALLSAGGGAARNGRRQALAEIANRLEKTKTDELLAAIEEEEPDEANAIRNLLFSFEDLPNVPRRARLVLFDAVPTETVTLCLRGAGPDVREAVTSALAARAKRMVEAELSQGVEVPAKTVAAARREVAALALRLASEGRIVLSAPKTE